jgi:uncharacterized phage protein (TIGR02218 family)
MAPRALLKLRLHIVIQVAHHQLRHRGLHDRYHDIASGLRLASPERRQARDAAMKSVSAALAAHLAGPVTTLATCWRITRRDGREFFFTDHDRDLVFEGEVYKASSGYSRTAIANDASLGVDNLDVEGVFDNEAITEQELRAGLFDQAEVRIFLVNWADPSMGALRMRRGWFGEVVLTEQGVFRTELRGLAQALSQRIGELYSPECRADLGDHRCKVPIHPPVVARATAYALGHHVRVATGSGSGSEVYENRIYACVVAGTTAAAQPVYDTTVGQQTTDGSAVFEAVEAWSRAGVVISVVDRAVFTASIDEPRAAPRPCGRPARGRAAERPRR